ILQGGHEGERDDGDGDRRKRLRLARPNEAQEQGRLHDVSTGHASLLRRGGRRRERARADAERVPVDETCESQAEDFRRRGKMKRILWLAALVSSVPSCVCTGHAAVRGGIEGAVCGATPSSAPLVVEWTGPARAKLEAVAGQHVAVVRQTGCDIEILAS